MTRIAVAGASGRMGQAIIEAIGQTSGVVLGVALDKGDDLSALLGQFDVLIDFVVFLFQLLYFVLVLFVVFVFLLQ